MAEQARPTEGRRRREPEATANLHQEGEILLWLATPAGTLLGWAPEATVAAEWGGEEEPFIVLRLPVILHQVPAGDGAGGVGIVQLYAPLPVDELVVYPANVIAYTLELPDSDPARVHAAAWRQREGGGRVLVLPAAPSGLAH